MVYYTTTSLGSIQKHLVYRGHCTLRTVYTTYISYALCTVHCTQYSVLCILILHDVQCTVYTIDYSLHRTVYNIHYTICIMNCRDSGSNNSNKDATRWKCRTRS